MSELRFTRSSGVVMPVFSLPSPYGIGTLGKSAYDFVSFLKSSGQKYWQMLPLGHTGFGDSPYQTFSVVAGNPYFIDLDLLVDDGLLSTDFINSSNSDLSYDKVDYGRLNDVRWEILREAKKNVSSEMQLEINQFTIINEEWLPDYALFMSLKKHFKQKPLWDWTDSLAQKRDSDALNHYKNLLKDDIEFYIFLQYLFFKQLQNLKDFANRQGIEIIGDIPIYPSLDSCDVWAHPELFKVDENFKATGAAGVPPDLYSATGQLWGNPVYNWEVHKTQNFNWWIWRIKKTLEVFDVIRIDHFRGFYDFWEIPAGETTALNGKWQPGPRMDLFDAIKKELGDIKIIAEDLGIITEQVRDFLVTTGYPGMKVLIFALEANEDNVHLPHNFTANTVGYTSTHDSETFFQKYSELSLENKLFTARYINLASSSNVGMAAIRSVFGSPSIIAMTQMQDVLCLGEEGRINTPSTIGENWCWRMKPDAINNNIIAELKEITTTYKRNC